MNPHMTLEQIRARLAESELPKVQSATGLAYNTLKNVRDGKGVLYDTVVQLSNYFRLQDQKQ